MTQAKSNRDGRAFKSADSLAGRSKMRRASRGRTIPPPRKFQIREAVVKAVNENTLTVRFLKSTFSGGVLQRADAVPVTEFEIARPVEHRRFDYEGVGLIDPGITYAYVGAQERTATDGSDNETQLITPPYVVDVSRVLIAPVSTPAGLTLSTGSAPVHWIDLNNAGRAWAKELA